MCLGERPENRGVRIRFEEVWHDTLASSRLKKNKSKFINHKPFPVHKVDDQNYRKKTQNMT